MLYRKWKIKNIVALDVRSAAHLEAFLIKQGVLFLAGLMPKPALELIFMLKFPKSW